MSLNVPPITEEDEQGGVRLLSFDGGDLRAVSQLIILDEFMKRIEGERNSTTRILPCDYFHMIGGVGASGIIVVLLVVLRMGIEETIEGFIQIWNQVFADASLDQSARSAKLEVVIKELLKRRGVDESRRMDDGSQVDHNCKAFVCAIPGSNMGICEKFRTYKSRETSLNPTIVEAIRATCAVPTLFIPVNIDSVACQASYVSGSYNFNNPSAETIKEACQSFGRDQRVACMLSLGCGQRAFTRLNHASEMAVMNMVNDFACDCERVDRDLGWRVGDSGIYYRLSVNRILESGDSFGASVIGEITSCTKGYLENHETTAKITKCVQASQGIRGVTLRDIAGLNEPKSTSIHGLPSLSEYFVERPALIKTMSQSLFQLGPSTQKRMVLSGLGGIGKTQITVSFLLQYLARFRHILFIDGSSEQSIERGLVAKVRSLGTTYSRSSASEALEVLSNPDYEITRDWAIIYDNVDNPKINIGQYIPSCAFGTIIVTTRNPKLGILALKGHIRLDTMSEEEAAEVLLRSAIGPSRDPTEVEKKEAHEIAKDLGYLPVALAQAGYFIRVHDCMHKYRERLGKRRPDILARPADYQIHPHAGLYATLNLTWPHLTAGAALPEHSWLTGRPSSFLNTIRLLCTAFRSQEESDEQDVDDLIAELEQYSLVTRMPTFKVINLRIHPLVQSWARERLPAEEAETYQAAAVRLLVCGAGNCDEDIHEFIYPHVALFSDCMGELHINDRAALATILAHQGDVAVATAIWEDIKKTFESSRSIWCYFFTDVTYNLGSSEVDLQLGRLYLQSSDYKKSRVHAFTLLRTAKEVRKRTLGPNHPKTVEAVQQVAGMGYYETEGLLRSALATREGRPGNDWEAVLQIKEALALCCDENESHSLYTEIMQERIERNGPYHHTTLKAMENLANHHLTDATDILVSLVAARANRRGREHPDTLDAMERLAHSYGLENLYDKAVEQWKEVVCLRKKMQGVDHCDTILAMENLVFTSGRTERCINVAALWEEIMQVIRGPTYMHIIDVTTQLARRYEGAREHTKAESQWKDAVRLTKDAHGPSHMNTIKAMGDLARFYERSRQFMGAVGQWKDILRVVKEVHGPKHKATLTATAALAIIYEKTKAYTKAEVKWEEIVRLTKEVHGPSHLEVMIAMKMLARMLSVSQQHTKAEPRWKELVQMMKDIRGPSQEETLYARILLGYAYAGSKKYEDAEVEWKGVLQVAKETQGPDHKVTFDGMEALVEMYQDLQKYAEAVEQGEEIVQMRNAHDPNSLNTLESRRRLANMYERNQQYTDARVQWQVIVRVTEGNGPEEASTLEAMEDLANFYERARQNIDAEVLRKKILRLRMKLWGPRYWGTLEGMVGLAGAYERTQRYGEAELQWKEIVRLSKEISCPRGYTCMAMGGLARVCKIRGRLADADAILIDAKHRLTGEAPDWVKVHNEELHNEVRLELARAEGALGEVECEDDSRQSAFLVTPGHRATPPYPKSRLSIPTFTWKQLKTAPVLFSIAAVIMAIYAITFHRSPVSL